jgi:hypothetical protein
MIARFEAEDTEYEGAAVTLLEATDEGETLSLEQRRLVPLWSAARIGLFMNTLRPDSASSLAPRVFCRKLALNPNVHYTIDDGTRAHRESPNGAPRLELEACWTT